MDKASRRDIKRQFRESVPTAGAFRIRNTNDGRILVSSARNVPATFNKLRMQLETGSYLMHPDLQKDWKVLGAEAFEFEILEELTPPEDTPGWDPSDDLKALEELWIEQLQPFAERGYNRRPKSD